MKKMNPIELTIHKMRELGFFQFLLPFMLTSAIFYGALRKSKIFGEPDRNITVNGVVALVAAFMVWAYPVIMGVNVEQYLASFFAHGMIATLLIMLALIISGLFLPPDLPKFLSERLKGGRGVSIIFITSMLIGVIVLISSGLISLFLPPGFSITRISEEFVSAIVVAIMLIGSVALIVFVTGGKETK